LISVLNIYHNSLKGIIIDKDHHTIHYRSAAPDSGENATDSASKQVAVATDDRNPEPNADRSVEKPMFMTLKNNVVQT
jgi:hypothetical protein